MKIGFLEISGIDLPSLKKFDPLLLDGGPYDHL